MIILVADDQHIDRRLLEAWLTKRGHKVLGAQDGVQALDLLRTQKVDLVIADILMPRMDGFQLCRRIREDPNLKDLPFIFYTATYTDQKDEELALKLGADRFIRKPAKPEEFVRAVEAVVEEFKAAPAGAPRREKTPDEELFDLHGERVVRKLEKKIAALESEAVRRERSEAALKSALKEKEFLLREVHHRVKNNMQIISSLLSLQADRIKDPRVIEALFESRNRVSVLALVHETLHRSDFLSEIDFGQYLHRLAGVLAEAYSAFEKHISVTVEAESFPVSIDQAVPCGLALNELVSNSLKHGFPAGRPGEIMIRVVRQKDGRVIFTVKDNGVGLPEGLDWRNLETLGLSLVIGLVEHQLKGTIELKAGPGTEFIVTYRA
ncbi:MAG: response regulator [Thermodesulfobacteriota bacterium]